MGNEHLSRLVLNFIMIGTFWQRQIELAGLGAIAAKVENGERLTPDDGLKLYQTPHLNLVGLLANQVRERWNGNVAWWVRNQHINYTNVCNKGCLFCSFYAKPKDDARAYVMSPTSRAESSNYRCADFEYTSWRRESETAYSYYLELLQRSKRRVLRRISRRSRWWKSTRSCAPQRNARRVFEDLKAADSMPSRRRRRSDERTRSRRSLRAKQRRALARTARSALAG
jgi:aminodeoxyfutalosine synthase